MENKSHKLPSTQKHACVTHMHYTFARRYTDVSTKYCHNDMDNQFVCFFFLNKNAGFVALMEAEEPWFYSGAFKLLAHNKNWCFCSLMEAGELSLI